ncbi:MAG: hypothetical protein ACLP59_17835 [Bryobacteraceae bacterium]
MGFTRRDLLKFTGGSVAGLALTPVPWGLLRDSALVSETWPGVPRPPHGEIRARFTTCTLCPAGCGVRARCVGDQPVSLAGVAGHPSSRGALCPVGLVGHHFAFCRGRAHAPLANGKLTSMESALAAVSAAIAECRPRESVAILDPRPGRTASLIYRRYLSGLPKGIHCAAPGTQPFGSFGIDLENTRAIVSFGEPVLDGWLTPGRVLANRSHFQLIQVEAAYSRTASLADLWAPVLPGNEEDFADAVIRALHGSNADARATETARLLLRNGPAIAVGGGRAADKLNAALGSVGRPGGFVARRDFTPAADIASVPDGSVRVLLIEEGTNSDPIPWDLLRCKLVAENWVVVALTPWLDGCARHANYVIPAPVYLESLDEAPTPDGSTVASFSLSPAMVAAPPNLISPADFVLRLMHDTATYSDVLKQRVAAIKKDGHGTIFTYSDAKSTPVREVSDLWKSMLNGGTWISGAGTLPAAASQAAQSHEAPPAPAATPEYPLLLVASETPPAHASPLMSKLYRESGLRRSTSAAALNPKTGRDQGLEDGCRALIESPTSSFPVRVTFDPAVMPGVMEVTGQASSPVNIRRSA